MLHFNRKLVLIEITYCLYLVPIGSLLTTWICLEPEPAWPRGFPDLMTQALEQCIIVRS